MLDHYPFFKEILSAEQIIFESEYLEKYAHDETEKIYIKPALVLKPATTVQVSAILSYCFKHNLPITPRGAGTGLSGGAIPSENGIVLSIEQMKQIENIDDKNLLVITQPGVITEVLQNEVRKKNLFFPPDPSSKGSCFIGGNIAENSGGPRAVKYGVMKDYVLNLEIVLMDGTILWTGANVLKNSTGYNLTQLIVGSEGTLALITKIVLKLVPLPTVEMVALASFKKVQDAAEAVSAIFRAGITPSALELMETEAIKITSQFLQSQVIPFKEEIEAQLIIEVDGKYQEVLYKEFEIISEVLEKYNVDTILLAEDHQQKEELWKLRRRVAEVVKANGYTIEEDTVVPRYYLPQLISEVKNLAKKYNFKVVCYGHAGDGNLHIRINHPTIKNSFQNSEMEKILTELFISVKNLGGTISGEHGIGLIQKKYLPIVLDSTTLNLMREIKQIFDPKNLLNPNKIF